ncbi:hypothetical protein [Sphingomonas kyeonggiensis]|uniref:Uncharacterized protein n=1 Tax=Sphingomonas kyeonggiensis TaxID=1268553 RepID=A0A7W6JNT9_9SPHN|nr:hypothetical protein [Sphingomonas kyeonggiensis]MBB4096809.1 hypothetical protein [Sphingomonas kyeonggiensis]
MASPITVDLDAAKAALTSLKANPPSHDDIASDPEAFLARLGIQVDADTLSTIQSKLSAQKALSSESEQAAIIHIDS